MQKNEDGGEWNFSASAKMQVAKVVGEVLKTLPKHIYSLSLQSVWMEAQTSTSDS